MSIIMSDPLLDALGLDDVSADPNKVPDNTYDAIFTKVDYVHSKAKNRLSRVFTFQVEAGDHKGAQLTKWFSLGKDPVIENGKPVSYTPTMSEGQKTWYKKMFTDLGIPEDQVASVPLESRYGTKVTITVKTSNGDAGTYQNVTNVRPRTSTAASTTEAPVDLSASAASEPVAADEASDELASQL